jgi:hypothetical protein
VDPFVAVFVSVLLHQYHETGPDRFGSFKFTLEAVVVSGAVGSQFLYGLFAVDDKEGISVILVVADKQLRHRVRDALPLKLFQYGLDCFSVLSTIY